MAVIPYDSKGDLIPFRQEESFSEKEMWTYRAPLIYLTRSVPITRLHLVLELGWANYVDDVPRDIQNRELTEKCLVYLHDLLKK